MKFAPLDVSKADEDQKKQILAYAIETRKFEIERFWQRSLFFWGFIGAAFVGYAALYDKDKLLLLVVSCFGLVCSVAWTLQNRGSKYWQEAWEQKVRAVELDVLNAPLFVNKEPIMPKGFWGAATFSVSKLAIALSDFTVLIWLALTVKAFQLVSATDEVCLAVAVVVFVAGYIACFFVGGRSMKGE